jgi:Domain of unknown function (DUF4261)
METPSSPSQQPADSQPKEDKNALILLFNQLPNIDQAEIASVISAIEPIENQVNVLNLVKGESSSQQPGWDFIEFDNHKLQLLGLNLRVPDSTMQDTIYTSGWSKPQQDLMRSHAAHMLCFYEGHNPDPIEQMIALYKVAFCFTDKGLIGVLDDTARNCMPSSMIEVMFEPGMLDSCRENIPLEFWTNLIKFSRPGGGVWLCTKGNHRFGIRDFAYLGTVEEIKATKSLFASLFHYLRESGVTFNPGETAQIGKRLALRFTTPIEFQDYLDSPLGTLVVQKIDLP